jgi:cytochrome c oxidase subunit III
MTSSEATTAQGIETGIVESHDSAENSKFGFLVFLLSESVIFLSFFAGYITYKTTINTVVLVSSSFVIYVAERFLHDKKLWGFRAFLLLTMVMGAYFLYGQAVEWQGLPFGFTSGVYGGTFYLLTGFHGLHVFTGILLQTIMLLRSFIPGNYDTSSFGIEATSLFWHFVDVIWIILYILIYVWQ